MKLTHLTKFFSLIAFLSLGPSSFLEAKEQTKWSINPDHSEILFSIPYLTISSVSGRFKKFSGSVSFKHKQPENIEIQIKSASIDTGLKKRDTHLKTSEFFDSRDYPHISFNSTKILQRKESPSHYIVTGLLTIKGIEKKININIHKLGNKKDTWGYKNLFYKFQFVINRKDFNIHWNKTLSNNEFLIGNEVKVKGTIQIQPYGQKTPSVKHRIPDTEYIRLREKLKRGEITAKKYKIETKYLDNINEELGHSPQKILSQPPSQPSGNSLESKRKQPPLPESIKNTEARKDRQVSDPRHSTPWRLSYYFVGLISFISIIFLMIKGKTIFLSLWPEQYQETGKLGMISDIIVYSIGFLYFWAYWILGYN